MWLIYSLLYPIGYTISGLIDKTIIDHHVKNVRAYPIVISLAQTLIIVPLALLGGIVFTPFLILWPILIGLLTGLNYFFFARALVIEGLSTIVPLIYLYPIFVVIFSNLFLGEKIALLKWLAIILIIFGSILISLERKLNRKIVIKRVFWLILSLAFVQGIIETMDKYAIINLPLSSVLFYYSLGFLIFNLGFLLVPSLRIETKRLVSKLKLSLVIGLKEAIIILANISFYLAIEVAPVSYVSAIGASQPFFVFLAVWSLGSLWPNYFKEKIQGAILIQKLTSTILIFAGVLIIALF